TGGVTDANDNASDFKFEDLNGTSAGAGQQLGAPGPENIMSPITNGGGITVTPADATKPILDAPNFFRDFTPDAPNNSTFGTVSYRLKITNNTGAALTKLRLRIIDLSTFPSPSGVTDLRPRTSSNATITVTGVGSVTAAAATLETPPAQPNGGGI